MSKAEMQAHLEELAAELGCDLRQRYNLAGMMYVEYDPPMVEAPNLAPCDHAPSMILCYFVGLHELGHVANGHTQGRPPFEDKTHYFDNGVLRSEAEAWEWALDRSLVIPNRRDCTYAAQNYIGSYILEARRANGKPDQHLHNGNRAWVAFTYDDPDDSYVQGIVDRLLNAHKGEVSA